MARSRSEAAAPWQRIASVLGAIKSTLASGSSASKGPISTSTKPSGTRGTAASAMPAMQEAAEEVAASSSASSSSSLQFLPFAR